MSWVTPKTDWTSTTGIAETAFNRIEGNISHLGAPGTQKAINNTLSVENHFHKIIGPINININYIATTGYVAGDRLMLQIATDGEIFLATKYGSPAPTGYAEIAYWDGTSGTVSFETGEIIELVYTGEYWMIVSSSKRALSL
jgi:hypothetical protein